MQSLLRWSIEHAGAPSQDGSAPRPEPKKLDPEIIDMILGKPDAEQMKEKLAVAVDEGRSEEERVQALDDFEMLIESIDNANDLEKLKMWQPLHDLLTSPGSTDEIKRQVLWVIGTAVQNNPAAQNVFLAMSPLPTILSFLAPSVPAQTRSKAVYALSGILKHNASAVRQLEEAGGWEVLRSALEDSDITVRRKTAFLINALLIPNESAHAQTQAQAPAPQPQLEPQVQTTSPSQLPTSSTSSASTALTLHSSSSTSSSTPNPNLHTPDTPSAPVHPNSHAALQADPSALNTSPPTLTALRSKALLPALINALVSPVPHGEDGENEGDADFEEKVVRLLTTYVMSCGGGFEEEEKKKLRKYLEREGRDGERWGLGEDELRVLLRALE
ncbi:Fes1-domain-containing protein [Gloeophyllum trabeum ATCC 11539]|uniref:Fes1-domain-containing protein n=1 Tax=Gloeophyllum trabeum (strain ATCC 11539 / FP-39264 / Madison 617) TaxID=670483 RepID=S7Q8V5_GLOTA|nr:Fes1-domain-containing protein [Gloeophyllum trabeum ATCC 11539]EPQ55957.1 Fes1-domain-containing protein [Gloeophyllum trabeum ATCC 11539]